MCGRIVWVWDAKTKRLIQKYDDGALDDPGLRRLLEKDRFNVPPSSHLPVVASTRHAGEDVSQEGDGGPAARRSTRGAEAHHGTQVEAVRWGFPIPKRPNGVFNTRIETAHTSPMWRGLIEKHHCVFPVKGFYEWKRPEKVPHFVRRRDGAPMLLAGLIGTRRIDAEATLCGSIVTCAPNAAMSDLHDRMPVIVEAADADDWLHPDTAGHERIMDLASPAGDVLEIEAVDDRVNSTQNDDPGLIEPRKQRSLF